MTDETRADLADSLASLYEKFAKELPLLENEMEIAIAIGDVAGLRRTRDRLDVIWKQCEAALTEARLIIDQRIAMVKADKL